MRIRPLRGRRGFDQFVLIAVPTVLIGLTGAVALQWHQLHVVNTTNTHVQASEQIEVPARIAWNITLEELNGTFQGPINTGKESAWLVVQIDHPHVEEDVVVFHYTINSPARRRSGNGSASLIGRWIELGTLKGQIVRNSKGLLAFRSTPRNTKPDWMLEASR